MQAQAGEPFSLFLRIPGWCERADATINGEPVGAEARPVSYVELRRCWRSGDRIQLSLPMPARRIESHPYVPGNQGRGLGRSACVEQL